MLIQIFLRPEGRRCFYVIYISLLTISGVFLIVIPYIILSSINVCFGSNYRILPSRRKPRHTTPCLFGWCDLKKTSPYHLPPRICKGLNKIGQKITWEWERGHFLVFSKGHLPHLPCKEVHIRPQLPLNEVNNGKVQHICVTYCKCVAVLCRN